MAPEREGGSELPDAGGAAVHEEGGVDGASPPPVDGGAPPSAADASPSPPISVGAGVTYERLGPGDAVLIAYGGYSAELSYSQAWARELARVSLAPRGVGHIYAVQGPADPGYDGLEIGNSGLRGHIGAAIAAAAPFVFVVAHSSGAFVAHELLQQLSQNGGDATLAKIVYANLDGGGGGFSSAIAERLRRASFVYAKDPTLASGLSANASSAQSLGNTYSSYGSTFEVSVPNSGCNSGAKWCLHDLVITHRPHDPTTYDLAADYTDFVGRPVTTEYVDALAAYLQ